ncbi:hypothetical protein ACIQVO_29820 [Streptomyces sp. NPDC101062]|uniref:hypothetical protein n=1 Tax=unclassified Streptomyces TaxID=2593676 RepID=UPI0038113A8C
MSNSPAPPAAPPPASAPVAAVAPVAVAVAVAGERATPFRAARATLVDIPFERVEVIVHPQSYVHSMAEFTDGRTPAQAAPPDLRGPEATSTGRTHAEARA